MDIFKRTLDEHRQVLDAAARELAEPFQRAATTCARALGTGGKILAAGNGGSAADAQHLVAELVGRFEAERRGLPAVALTTDTSILTAVANDYGFERVFARQVEALGAAGDVLLAISTSGGSTNVCAAAEVARARGLTVVALTGAGGGRLAELADVLLAVPARRTARIQEIHELVLHALAEHLEAALGVPAHREAP